MAPRDVALFEQWTMTHDADVFADIVSRYSAMVYGTCTRILGNTSEAEDVAQECFIELAQSDAAIKRSLGGWLHTMATRRSLDRIKAEKRRKGREARFAAKTGGYAEPDWHDLKAHIDEAIAELPETLRVPVVCRFLEGRTHEAIAESLGVSRSTVQYRQRKGLEEVRKKLKRRGVIVGVAALAALLQTNLAEAVALKTAPASLTAALGKLAIAVSLHAGKPAAVAAGATAASKLVTVGGALATAVAATALFAAGVFHVLNNDSADPRAQATSASGAAEGLTGTGELRGSVYHPDGRPAAGADVLMVSLSPLGHWRRTCDANGTFRFEAVPTGATYMIVATHGPSQASTEKVVRLSRKKGAAALELHLLPQPSAQ